MMLRLPRPGGSGRSGPGRWRRRATAGAADGGQVSLLILGLTLVAAMLVVGGVAITSAHLSRMRLLDAADGAALDAADALDVGAYGAGFRGAVALTDETVQQTATSYLAGRPRPVGMLDWHVSEGTGSPDGQTAVVRLTGQADLPMIGGALRALGGSVSITVQSRARADLQ